MMSSDFNGFVGYNSVPEKLSMEVIQIPADKILQLGKTYDFEYKTSSNHNNAIIYNSDWHFALKKNQPEMNLKGYYDGVVEKDGTIRFSITCDFPGTLKLSSQSTNNGSYYSFLEYMTE